MIFYDNQWGTPHSRGRECFQEDSWEDDTKFDICCSLQAAKVEVGAKYCGRLIGLCGDCNGKMDDMQVDGIDISNDPERFIIYSNKWKIPDEGEVPDA